MRFVFLIVIIQQIGAIVSSECGVRKLKINHAIVHGQPTTHGDWPWHVAVYHREYLSNSYACGGTLISDLFVLTANHCVRGINGYVLSKRRIFVRLGLHDLNELNAQTFQQHNVHHIHSYTVSNDRKNDIAILELTTVATFTDFVQPACLNLVEDLTDQFGTTVGWGADETDTLSPTLKSQHMPVVSTMQCIEQNEGIFRLVLDSSTFCAGYLNGTTVCNGDSGGGLYFERNGVWHVGGIVSFTAPRSAGNSKCDLKSYAGFTKVYYFLPWIRKVTGDRFGNEKTGKYFQMFTLTNL